MQTITLEIADNAIYEHLVGLVRAIKGVKIRTPLDTTSAAAANTASYHAPETDAQRARRELFASMRGAIKSTGIANTEAELKAMRDEWENVF
ncbi:MAG: hypothetical protein RI894_1032 [Bacteroidota bacterium]|jgi:hypothetical protein